VGSDYEFREGDIVSCSFKSVDNGVITLTVNEIVGNEEDARLDHIVVGIKENLHTDFSENVLNSVDNIPKVKTDRKNLSDRMIVTIDGITSKDLDDAIDISKTNEGYRLGVHIADVSYYVQEGSLIDAEAIERGTSVYLIDNVFPMLPQKLSNDLCSLNPDTEKLTMTVDMYFDSKFQIKKVDMYESTIISKYRLTYEEVDEHIKQEGDILRGDHELSEMIKDAFVLSEKLRNKKIKEGMIDFSLPETKIELDDNGETKSIYAK